jgi:lipopolysaccharide/colanic/teichoic acid biosynthesis glycosyltransferase
VKILSAILDSRPRYIGDVASPASLLLSPVGSGTLLCHYHARVRLPARSATVVLPFPRSDDHVAALTRACHLVEEVRTVRGLRDSLTAFDLPDWLLVADPRYFPCDGFDAAALSAHVSDDLRSAIHLVPLEANPGGATERVRVDSEGRVLAIQRYYDARTWNQSAGVACSLIPVAMLLAAGDGAWNWTSLAELRLSLAGRGLPSRDVPLPGGVLDLAREDALLRLNERVLHDETASLEWRAAGSEVAPTARLIGPVVLQAGARVEERARVVGPATIGAGARVGAGALVTQCLIGQGVEVRPATRVTHRAIFTDVFGDLGSVDPSRDDPDPTALREAPPPRPSGYRVFKGLVDSVAASVGLVLLSPLLLLITAAIKLESRGSAFFGEIRETEGGRLFRCWKFRTMYQGADLSQRELLARNEVDGPQFKIEGDPRITRVGRVLRKVSLDELPQLVNVLLGEMSLVGPRPSPFRENQICVPWREARLSVPAGITGLWQVCREDRTRGDFHQWIYYDVLYAQHVSLAVDLKILLATVLTGGGVGRVPVRWIIPEGAAVRDVVRA